MSETLLHRPASRDAEVLSSPDVAVHRAAPLARLAFRGDAVAAGKAGAAFGASLPMTPLASNAVGERAALWLGPDEWLLLAAADCAGDDAATVDAAARTRAASLAGDLSAALDRVPHALVDVSERNLALIVEGPRAADLLNTQVFLDLDPAAFPVGQVTRTLFTKAEIVLWRTAPERFVIEVWRSFVPYVDELLRESARGL